MGANSGSCHGALAPPHLHDVSGLCIAHPDGPAEPVVALAAAQRALRLHGIKVGGEPGSRQVLPACTASGSLKATCLDGRAVGAPLKQRLQGGISHHLLVI